MITFTCSSCRQTLSVPEANAGKKGKCPQCSNIVDIPMTSAPEVFSPAPSSAPPPMSGPSTSHAASNFLEPMLADAPGTSSSLTDFLTPCFVLAAVAFLASPYVVALKGLSSVASVMLGLACMGLAGFALALAIFGMLKAMAQRLRMSWQLLSALVISGTAVFVTLMMFIASFSVGRV